MDNKYIVDILYYMLKQQGIHAYRADVCIATDAQWDEWCDLFDKYC